MPRPPIDLPRKIKDILQHVQPLPDEAKAPILHYRRTGTDIRGLLAYVERAFGEGSRYQAVVDRHLENKVDASVFLDRVLRCVERNPLRAGAAGRRLALVQLDMQLGGRRSCPAALAPWAGRPGD